jgi:hypothetical protein
LRISPLRIGSDWHDYDGFSIERRGVESAPPALQRSLRVVRMEVSSGCGFRSVLSIVSLRSTTLLTENEVSRSWNRMFGSSEIEASTFDRAELLLDELRPESPLRHRLSMELEELRERHASVAAE